MCLSFPRWRRRNGNDDSSSASKPRRARTLPILRTNTENLPALREMINTTLLIPTKHPRLRTPTFRSLGGRAGLPRIHITGADMARRASMHGYDALPELDDAFYDKLEHAFTDICRRKSILSTKEPFITREQLVAWLENTQGEDPEEVEKFLPQEKEKYHKGEFLEMLLMRFGCDAERPVNLDEKDLAKPITNYFISSSHNTYIEGNQLASRSSPEAYKTVLERGCRCIEIDVWNGDVNTVEPPRTATGGGGGSGTNGGGGRLTKPEHSRNLSAASGTSFSGTSLPNAAASVIETVGGTMASILGGGGGDGASVHSRKPSDTATAGAGPRDSALALSYPRDEPIVTHGWTLTKPCGFREVCVAIRESAFETNDLPIIISLEVHADHGQQEVMVRIMKEEWGDMLLDEPLDGIDQRFRVPSLGDLRRKILIKVKKPPRKIEVPESTLTLSPGLMHDSDASDSDGEDNTHMVAARAAGVAAINKQQPPAGGSGAPPKAARIPVGPVLGALAIYTHSERFKRFEEASKKPSHIYSIEESRILELNGTHHREMFTHNKNYFMRLFPNGSRIDSSNPDPSLFWRKGVQMVSLNWQYIDEALMLNEGMFAGEQGWVLKPPGYLGADRACVTQADVPGCAETVMLTVSVLAGQDIWVPHAADSGSGSSQSAGSLRPVVKCELHVEKPAGNRAAGGSGSEPALRGSEKYKLETSAKKGDRPVWGDRHDTLKFPLAQNVVESLSFVRFKVENESRIGADELLSWACIRLDRLRPGYRYVRLMDTKGRPIKDGKLLVRIHKVVR